MQNPKVKDRNFYCSAMCVRRLLSLKPIGRSALLFSISSFLLLFLSVSAVQAKYNTIFLINTKTDMRLNPLGMDHQNPTFSWNIFNTDFERRDIRQMSCQILVSSSLDKLNNNDGDMWNSEMISTSRMSQITYGGRRLISARKYWWKVRIWDETSKTCSWSQPSYFVTGIFRNEDWHSNWVSKLKRQDIREPLITKTIHVNNGLRLAILHISSSGKYRMEINHDLSGKKILNPQLENPDTTSYNTYDITDRLLSGLNLFEFYGVDSTAGYRERRQDFLVRLQLEYKDGSTKVIGSDPSWQGVKVRTRIPYPVNGQSSSLPIVIPMERVPVQTVRKVADDIWLYDFGADYTITPEILAKGKQGASIKLISLQSDELKDEVNLLENANSKNADSKWVFKFRGESQEFFHKDLPIEKSRYFLVEKFAAKNDTALPDIQSFVGQWCYPEIESIGEFESSDTLLNAWYEKSRIVMRNKLLELVRNEHSDSLNVDLESSFAINYNYSVAELLTSMVAGMKSRKFQNISKEFIIKQGFSLISMPWKYYVFTGDPIYIKILYRKMQEYMNKLDKMAIDHFLFYNSDIRKSQIDTDEWTRIFAANAFYSYSHWLMSKMAEVMNDFDERVKHEAKAEAIRQVFNKNYYHSDTFTYGFGTPLQQSLPLVFDLVPELQRIEVGQKLVDDLQRNNFRIQEGVIPNQYLMKALSVQNFQNVIDTLVRQEVAKGKEDWLMMGTEWLFHDLGGVSLDDMGRLAGFRKLLIKPHLIDDLDWVRCSTLTSSGYVSVSWQKFADKLSLGVSIPPNTQALVYIPLNINKNYRATGLPNAQDIHVRFYAADQDYNIYEVDSGNYQFEIRLNRK